MSPIAPLIEKAKSNGTNGLHYQGLTAQGSQILFSRWFDELERAPEEGKKCVYFFSAGNISELTRSFGMVTALPEVTSIQSSVRKEYSRYAQMAEGYGYSPDICGFVIADVGLHVNERQHVKSKIPKPDLVICNDVCQVYLKWSEIWERFYKCPVYNIDLPGARSAAGNDPETHAADKAYVVAQLKEVVELCEQVTGVKFDIDKLRENMTLINRQAEAWTKVLRLNKHIPAPFDAWGEGPVVMGGFNVRRGTEDPVQYLEEIVIPEMEERIAHGITPIPEEKFRLYMYGAPCYAYHRRFADLFHENGAIIAYSNYISGVIGGWDRGFRYDLNDPFGSIAEMLLFQVTASYISDCYIAVDLAKQFVEEYRCDGAIWHGIKSCRLSTAPIADFRETFQSSCGIPALLLETDIVDPRYFAEAQLKNRIDAFFEALAQKKFYGVGTTGA